MLKNNLKNGTQYAYFDLQFVNGQWFAWYYELESLDKQIEGTSKKGG